MDLTDKEEHLQFREEVRAFLTTHKHRAPGKSVFSFRNQPKKRRQDIQYWQALLVEHGYSCRTIPKQFGGFGAEPDIMKNAIIADEFYAAEVIQGLGNQGISLLVPTLLEHGTEEQKQLYISDTIRSKIIWCQGYSEPNAGSDLASLQTTAVLAGDDFVINGQKIWTSSAQNADMMFCLARSEPDAPKHKGISYFIFPMDLPGIEVRPLMTMTGSASFSEVFFTDVRVPKNSLVGERGNGWAVANSTLKHERGFLGDPNRSLDSLIRVKRLLETEKRNGKPLMADPLLRDRFIQLQTRVQAMRMHAMRNLTESQQGVGPNLATQVVKLLGCELNLQLDTLGVDILAEIGILYDDSPMLRENGAWQTNYMFDLGIVIGGGTAQIQKNIIAERGLGMPREPKPVIEGGR